uniref:Phlebovirus_G2 domain-containing protein n=1 Tax=Heterorhabditis bacteriophora TaxID=37862 RepID=A0A1I7XEH4_HETBA
MLVIVSLKYSVFMDERIVATICLIVSIFFLFLLLVFITDRCLYSPDDHHMYCCQRSISPSGVDVESHVKTCKSHSDCKKGFICQLANYTSGIVIIYVIGNLSLHFFPVFLNREYALRFKMIAHFIQMSIFEIASLERLTTSAPKILNMHYFEARCIIIFNKITIHFYKCILSWLKFTVSRFAPTFYPFFVLGVFNPARIFVPLQCRLLYLCERLYVCCSMTPLFSRRYKTHIKGQKLEVYEQDNTCDRGFICGTIANSDKSVCCNESSYKINIWPDNRAVYFTKLFRLPIFSADTNSLIYCDETAYTCPSGEVGLNVLLITFFIYPLLRHNFFLLFCND